MNVLKNEILFKKATNITKQLT